MTQTVEPQPAAPIVPASPAPVVIYRTRTSPLVAVLLTLLVLCVLALTAVIALPYLGIQLKGAGQPQVRTKEQILAELDPQAMVLPNGRQLSLVEFGQRVFEVTRIVYDANNQSNSLVYITVPGLPPQQGVYRAGDSFDRGRIAVKAVLRQSVILACDGLQQEYPVIGATMAPSPSGGSGVNIILPKDFSSGGVMHEAIPGTTGRIKAPLNPRITDDTPVGAPDDPELRPKSLEDFPDERHLALPRAEYKSVIENLRKSMETSMVLMPALDPENRSPYGLEIKRLDTASVFYNWGLKSGDILIQMGTTEIRRHGDVQEALRQNNFRDGLAIHVMRNDLLVSFFVVPSDAR